VPPELAVAAAGPTEAATTFLGTPAPAPEVTAAPTAAPTPAPAATPAPPPRARGRPGWIANLVLALAVLVTSLTVAGFVTGVLPFDRGDDPSGAGPSATAGSTPAGAPTSAGSSASAGSSTSAAPSVTGSPRASQVVAQDPLTAPKLWQTREDAAEKTTCLFDDALVVTRDKPGPYRCPGPTDAYNDFALAVDVRLRTEGACAAIWFRFGDTAGYLVRICREGFYLATHGVGDGRTVQVLRTMPFDGTIQLDTAIRVGISVQGTTIALERDGDLVGTVQDATFTQGRMVLGIFPEPPDREPPFSVTFKNVEVRAFTG
jgi:hypothetical protein